MMRPFPIEFVVPPNYDGIGACNMQTINICRPYL